MILNLDKFPFEGCLIPFPYATPLAALAAA